MIRKTLLVTVLVLLVAGCSQPAKDQQPASQPAPTLAAAPTVVLPTKTSAPPPTSLPATGAPALPEKMPTMPMDGAGTHQMPEIGRTEPAPPAAPTPGEFGHDHLMEGPHIRLAPMPPASPEDKQRAAGIAQEAHDTLAKYADYRVALQDGYEIFVPEVPQEVYHFINFREAYRNYNSQDPARPTALLYKKVGDGYEWAGVMYSAPMSASPEELDRRYPLSMAQWHAHIDVCLPPQGMGVKEALTAGDFAFEGSITTQDACRQAGGRFMPDVFGWMVHVMFNPSPTATD